MLFILNLPHNAAADWLSVFLIASDQHRDQVVSDYESIVNSAAASISQAVVAVACRTLEATAMAKLKGVPSAYTTAASFEGSHLVSITDAGAAA